MDEPVVASLDATGNPDPALVATEANRKLQDRNEAAARARQDGWDLDPAIGSPWDPDQATMAARWDVRSFWKKLAHDSGLSENAAMIGFELYHEALCEDRWTSYSRTDEHYASHPKSAMYTKRRVVGGVDELDEAGLVWNWKQVRDGRDWQSACKAKPALVTMVQAIVDTGGRPYPARPKSELLLRDADGKAIPIRETADTRRMAMDLHDYNNLMRSTDVSGGRASCVRRVFNMTTKQGGRHYCLGLGFQRMPSWQRALLTIGGATVGEFDYGSLHPSLMYAMAGLPIPEDAYDLAWWDRDLQKVGFLVVVNAEDRDQALHSIASKPAMAKVAVPGSDEAFRVATALYDELEERHRAVSHMFSTGIGRILQRRDSDMMAAILKEMTKAKRLTLPVFDSCIVAESDADLLQDVMRRVSDRAGLEGIRIEKVVPKGPISEEADFVRFPVKQGRVDETSRLMPSSLPLSSSFLLPPFFQDMEQEDSAALRRAEGEAPLVQAEGRTSLPSSIPTIEDPLLPSSIPVSDSAVEPETVLNALRIDSHSDMPEDASTIEYPLKSSLPRSQAPSVLHLVPSIVETFPMPAESDTIHRSAVLAACRHVHGPAFEPRYGEKHIIRRADGPARRTVMNTLDEVADVWAPESGPVLVRMSSRDGERSTTVVAPNFQEGLAMGSAYLHGTRRGGCGDLIVEAMVYGRYDPSIDPATNRLAAQHLAMTLPEPKVRPSPEPIPAGVPVLTVAVAPEPVRQPDPQIDELRRSFGVSSLADLPYGAAKAIAKPKPKPKRERV